MAKRSPAAESGTTQPFRARKWLLGPLVTLTTLVTLELLAGTPFYIPEPAPVALLALVFAAFHGGFGPGMLSAAFYIFFHTYFYAGDGNITAPELRGLLILIVEAPLAVILVGILKERASGFEAERKARRRAEEAEKALRASEEFKNRMIESSRDCIKILDLDAKLVWMNEGGQRLLEIDLASALNTNWLEGWHGQDRAAATEAVRKAKEGGVGRFTGFFPTGTGKPKWWDVVVTPIHDEGGYPVQLLAVSRDVTEQRNLEAARKRQELESALEAQKAEQRQRLGRELHDGIRQQLVGMKMLSANLHKQLKARGAPEADLIREFSELIGEANAQVRQLITDMVPVSVRAESLVPALQRAASNVALWYGISCKLHCPEQPVQITDEKADHLFHIAQEAMNNAAKHSKGSQIDVYLHQRDNELVLEVRDDGVGLPPDSTERGGMGLANLGHRAEIIGADLHLRKVDEGGTAVLCRLENPLQLEGSSVPK